MENQSKEYMNLELYIGKRLREKRQKLGMTLAFVANKLGVSHQQIQKYEQAQSRVSAGTLYQIAQLYGVASNYFFEGFSALQKPNEKRNEGIIFHNLEKSLNILLVEDDPADELLTRRALESAEQKVNIFCVHDGAQAIEFLRYKKIGTDFPRPDIILLDLNIPKRDGQNILKEIKRDRELQDIPVIILTNNISVQEMINAYRSYAGGYICKTFDYESFQKNLNTLIKYWSHVNVLPNKAYDEGNFLQNS